MSLCGSNYFLFWEHTWATQDLLAGSGIIPSGLGVPYAVLEIKPGSVTGKLSALPTVLALAPLCFCAMATWICPFCEAHFILHVKAPALYADNPSLIPNTT